MSEFWDWYNTKLIESGTDLSDKAKESLAFQLDYSKPLIEREIEKLKLLKYPITSEVVAAVVPFVVENYYDLLNFALKGESAKLDTLLRGIGNNPDVWRKLYEFLVRFWSQAYLIACGIEADQSAEHIETITGIELPTIRRIQLILADATTGELRQMFEYLVELGREYPGAIDPVQVFYIYFLMLKDRLYGATEED